MQKHFAKFKRGLAMFLVMLSLVGAVPLGAFDLTMIAGAIGDVDRGQSVRAMTGGSVGTHVGNWQADVGSTPFVRYSLVKFPNEANHPDQYEVLGQISVCDDKWKSILTAADSYWLGAPSGSYGSPWTAADSRIFQRLLFCKNVYLVDALGRSVRDSAPFARGGPRETTKAAQGHNNPSTAEANAQPTRNPLESQGGNC